MKSDFIEKIYAEPEYYDTVKNTILHMMKNGISKHDLEDCISDVYVTALKKRHEIEKHPCVHGWLILTSQNIAKRYIKRKVLEKVFLLDKEDFNGGYDNRDEEQRLYHELLDLLQKALKGSEYKLFTMKFVEKVSTAEIADILGIKPHSVEARVTRLKKKVKNILDKA